MSKPAKGAAKKKMTKSALFTHLSEEAGLKKSEVTTLYNALVEVIAKELKKNSEFTLPGVAKLKVKRVPAVKGGEKKVMPATGKEYVTKAKPASNKIRAIPAKALKDMLG
jgi:nucleoid DNA-binding protein